MKPCFLFLLSLGLLFIIPTPTKAQYSFPFMDYIPQQEVVEFIQTHGIDSMKQFVMYSDSVQHLNNFFVFDSLGHVLQWESGFGRGYRKYTYSYNERGHRIQMDTWNHPENDAIAYSFQYQTDSLGNPIRQETVQPNGDRKLDFETEAYQNGDTAFTRKVRHGSKVETTLSRTYFISQDTLIYEYIDLNEAGKPIDFDRYFQVYSDSMLVESGTVDFEDALSEYANTHPRELQALFYDKTYPNVIKMNGKLKGEFVVDTRYEYFSTGKLKHVTDNGGVATLTSYAYNEHNQLIKAKETKGRIYDTPSVRSTDIYWEQGLPVRFEVYKNDQLISTWIYEYGRVE